MGERHGDAADLQAIDRVREEHIDALNAGDADAWVAQFANDGVQMPPNVPANVGKERIGVWSGGLLNSFEVKFDLDAEEVRVLGDWAFECGKYTIELNPAAGVSSLRDSGKYITIYQKGADDIWRMARDIWNSSNPLPGM